MSQTLSSAAVVIGALRVKDDGVDYAGVSFSQDVCLKQFNT